MTIPHRVATFALLIIFACPQFAQGSKQRFGPGRTNTGQVTVLVLTQTQIEGLAKNALIRLSTTQRETLKKEAGFSPSFLAVYDVRNKAVTIPVWRLHNFALRYANEAIEVPHKYLVSDAEVEKRDLEF